MGLAALYTETTREFDRASRLVANSVLTRNRDGTWKSLVINRDGDGHDDSSKTTSIDANGMTTITIAKRNPDGSPASSVTVITNADRTLIVTDTDADERNGYERVATESISATADGGKSDVATQGQAMLGADRAFHPFETMIAQGAVPPTP